MFEALVAAVLLYDAAAVRAQATGGGCVLAGGQSQLTPRRVRSVPRYYSLYMVSQSNKIGVATIKHFLSFVAQSLD